MYVQKVRVRLGSPQVEAHVDLGDPALNLLRQTRDLKTDLIARRTQSRQGVPRLALGSVAAEVLQDTHVPVAPRLLASPGRILALF